MAQSVEERLNGVRILLRSILEYLPTPVTSSGLIARSVPPGPAPGKRVPCGYCRRAGRVRIRGGFRVCPVCEGLGWRARRGPREKPTHPDYEQPWDEYLEAPVEEAEQHPAPMSAHLRDRTLERLDHEQALREGDHSSERFGWERERALYDAKGSYRELRRSLGLMRRRWPPGHAQIQRVYFWGASFQLSFEDGQLLEQAERWVMHEMRGPVRVPPWLAEHEGERKQRSVSDLQSEGMSAGQIARTLGIPKQKVRRMLLNSPPDSGNLQLVANASATPGEPERDRV